jgi:hypothetical protein
MSNDISSIKKLGAVSSSPFFQIESNTAREAKKPFGGPAKPKMNPPTTVNNSELRKIEVKQDIQSDEMKAAPLLKSMDVDGDARDVSSTNSEKSSVMDILRNFDTMAKQEKFLYSSDGPTRSKRAHEVKRDTVALDTHKTLGTDKGSTNSFIAVERPQSKDLVDAKKAAQSKVAAFPNKTSLKEPKSAAAAAEADTPTQRTGLASVAALKSNFQTVPVKEAAEEKSVSKFINIFDPPVKKSEFDETRNMFVKMERKPKKLGSKIVSNSKIEVLPAKSPGMPKSSSDSALPIESKAECEIQKELMPISERFLLFQAKTGKTDIVNYCSFRILILLLLKHLKLEFYLQKLR